MEKDKKIRRKKKEAKLNLPTQAKYLEDKEPPTKRSLYKMRPV